MLTLVSQHWVCCGVSLTTVRAAEKCCALRGSWCGHTRRSPNVWEEELLQISNCCCRIHIPWWAIWTKRAGTTKQLQQELSQRWLKMQFSAAAALWSLSRVNTCEVAGEPLVLKCPDGRAQGTGSVGLCACGSRDFATGCNLPNGQA